MNTKNNLRYRENEDKFLNAMVKLLDTDIEFEKITVDMICKEASLNRSTFYRHFQDSRDVLTKLYYRMSQEMSQATKPYWAQKDYLINPEYYKTSLSIMKKNRKIIKASHKVRSMMPIMEGHNHSFQVAFLPYMKERTNKSEEDIYYLFLYFESAWLAIANKWIDNGCKESTKHIANLIVDCVEGTAFSLI